MRCVARAVLCCDCFEAEVDCVCVGVQFITCSWWVALFPIVSFCWLVTVCGIADAYIQSCLYDNNRLKLHSYHRSPYKVNAAFHR